MQPNNPVPAKRAAGKIRSVRQAVACALAVLALAVTPLPATAGDPGLHMELNKVEDVDGRCHGLFVIRNTLGQSLDRFAMELILFSQDGAIKQSILLDVAPLPDDKTTVARFVLSEGKCAGLGRVLVNKFHACASNSGAKVDCLSGLDVSSRAGIEFFK